ncbi:MAG: hypothetical protein IJG36_04240 [Synergistaceae bacterium]|nr:hypothetical protein [Synergistaceae bacterium]
MPGLRENLDARLKRDIRIDDEFAELIPPLSEDEYSRLEQSIIDEGCREAIIVWDGVIVDGHNRYKICQAHGIPFSTKSKDFRTREEAMLWMMQNQLARRNLTDFQRVEIVRRYEEAVRAKSEERQKGTRFGGGGKITTTAGKSRDTLGALAGVSGRTYEHATAIIDNAPEAVKEAVRTQAVSINAGYEVTKLPPETQAEISRRIREGEPPRKVVAEARKRKPSFTISPNPEDAERVKALADKNGLTVQDMLVRLIHEALSSKKYTGEE